MSPTESFTIIDSYVWVKDCTVVSYIIPLMEVLFNVIMRPSSLGGGRIMRRTLSVRLSVRIPRFYHLFAIVTAYVW